MEPRAVLVTGASTGIGRATAIMLSRLGFVVFAGVRRKQDGDALVEAAAGTLIPVSLDVTDPKHIAAAVSTILGEGHGLYGLVNNAGIAVAAPLELIPIADFRHQLEVNVIGQVAVTQAVLPLLRASHGRIVNVTSIGGLVAGPMLGPYHASKFALEALTDTMRVELRPWGIDVSAVEPGQISTPIWSTAAAASDRSLSGREEQADQLYGEAIASARASAVTAQEKGISPDRVAEVILSALTAKRPRTRYLVGTDAKLIARVVRRLPTRARDRLMIARRS